MSERVRELYQKLYNQNYQLLEEKKKEVKEEKTSNNTSVAKSVVSRSLLKIAIELITFIFIFLMIKFMIRDMTPDYRPGQASLTFMFKILIPFSIITVVISFIYQVVIRPRRTIQRNYWVKNSTTDQEEYNDIFCEKICKPIIEYVIPNSQYDHSYGMSQELYESMGFSNSHEAYVSTDNIRLNSNTNLIMSKVHSKFKDGGAYGYWYATLFCGIASIYTLTFNIPISIKIRNRKLDSLKLKNAIQSSNEKFNQYYEIETDNPDLLNKYCTNSMLACFVELAKKNINLEVNIFQNKICIRLHDKDFLDFNIKSELDEENIINSCNSIIAIINTNKFIIEGLQSNNIY